jgi:predicted DNA-binding transcriptional regulator YafY
MSRRATILRHNIIIKKLRYGREASFKEICDYLKQEAELAGEDLDISKRTFQRDLNDIRTIYDIDIQCNSNHSYYIADEGIQPEVNTRMLEAFDLYNSLKMAEGVSPFIYLEKRRPQGTEHIYGLLHAIQNRRLLQFDYQKFWEDEPTSRITEPYGLKEFKSRWYLLAKDRKDGKIKTFGLDRMQNIEITREKFTRPNDFDADKMFSHCFGIITASGAKPQEIILSFHPEQGQYIKTYALHESQKIIKDNEDELQIKLILHITHDFIMELLSHGELIKVIAPISLKNEVCKAYSKALKQY